MGAVTPTPHTRCQPEAPDPAALTGALASKKSPEMLVPVRRPYTVPEPRILVRLHACLDAVERECRHGGNHARRGRRHLDTVVLNQALVARYCAIAAAAVGGGGIAGGFRRVGGGGGTVAGGAQGCRRRCCCREARIWANLVVGQAAAAPFLLLAVVLIRG